MLKSRMLKRSITRVCTLAMAIVMTMASTLSHAQDAKGKKNKSQNRAAANRLTEEQKAVHLLDRATFGPRPGDVERVLKMGWQKYLDEQLHPERISDDIAEQKLRNIESYNLSNANKLSSCCFRNTNTEIPKGIHFTSCRLVIILSVTYFSD